MTTSDVSPNNITGSLLDQCLINCVNNETNPRMLPDDLMTEFYNRIKWQNVADYTNVDDPFEAGAYRVFIHILNPYESVDLDGGFELDSFDTNFNKNKLKYLMEWAFEWAYYKPMKNNKTPNLRYLYDTDVYLWALSIKDDSIIEKVIETFKTDRVSIRVRDDGDHYSQYRRAYEMSVPVEMFLLTLKESPHNAKHWIKYFKNYYSCQASGEFTATLCKNCQRIAKELGDDIAEIELTTGQPYLEYVCSKYSI